MVERLARLVTGHPVATLVFTIALTLLAIARLVDFSAVAEQRWAQALRLEIDPSMSSVLPRESEGRVYHERMRAVFGNDETLLVAVRHPDGIFQKHVLEAVTQTTERIEELDGIRSVVSLATAPDIRSADGELIVAPLYEDVPDDADGLAAIETQLRRNPVLASSLISDDGKTTAIVGYLLDMTELEFMSSGLDMEIQQIAAEEFGDEATVWMSGGAHVKAETQRTLLSDLMTVMPLCVLTLMAIAYVSFRTVRGIFVPLLTLGIAIVWTLALASIFFPKLNIVTTSVPAILLGVGFAYAIHVLSCYYEVVAEKKAGHLDADIGSATREAIRRVGLATLLTGLTTGVGFASLATSPITAIQEFGLLASIGVVCLMISTLTFAPALLQLMPEKETASGHGQEGGDWIERLLERLGEFDVNRRWLVLATGALLAIGSILAIPLIELSTSVLDNFPEDQPVRVSIEAINEHLGAADQMYVMLEADEKNTFKEPEVLRAIERLQVWLNEQPEVGGSTSVVDYVKLLNRSFHDDDPAYFAVPDSAKLVTQLIFFGGNDDLKRLVNSQYNLASIPVRVNVFNSGEVVAFADRVEKKLGGLPDEVSGRVSGLSVLVARSNDDIAYGQALSLSTAFIIIYVIMAALFWSFRIGFYAMLPNILPVTIYFGALAVGGITLNVVTGLVACLVLGIAVDDTIHFLTRFNALGKEQADAKAGARGALMEVGRAVTYTSTALVLAFFVLTASSLQQQVQFGALAAFTLAVAWVVDITFTPALASGLRIVTLWDLVSLDLGDEPHKRIGLFDGLGPTQARVAGAMAGVLEVKKGQTLFHAHEPAAGLFVVISGAVRSWAGHAEDTARVHGRGECVGEAGLFHGSHAVHAVADEDTRLLRLTDEHMAHLSRRYPKVAAIVMRNTSRLLAGSVALHHQGHELAEAFGQREGRTPEELLGAESHLGNPQLEASLESVGVTASERRALGLVPLVMVAWADGKLDDKEREAILEAAEGMALSTDGKDLELLTAWLATPPDQGLFEAWRAYVHSVLPQLSVEGALRLEDVVVKRARAVADAAGGVAGLKTTSRAEERMIQSLVDEFREAHERNA